ncbi:MAG TPA: tetratricopeptide repeat protein [Ktedonobacterales bacterium]
MRRTDRSHLETSIVELNPAQKMGKRLREARLRLSMTQSEVAGDQFSVSYISAVERGQIRPSLGALEQLSERLEVPLADLVSDERGVEPLSQAGREAAAERRQEEVEAKLRLAQIQVHQGKRSEALDTLRAINITHLAGYNAMELRRLLAACYIELDQPSEARKEAQDGIALAERLGDTEMRAILRNQLGSAYLLARKTQLALEQFRLAYEAIVSGDAPDPTFRLTILNNLGATYWLLNETADAIGYLKEAVKLAKELDNPAQEGAELWSLSARYTSSGDARRAKQYATRAIALYDQAEHRALASRAYTRLGRATAQTNQIDEALDYLKQAQAMTERERDTRSQSEVQRSLAAVFVSQKRLAEAKVAAAKALELAQDAGDDVLVAEAQLAVGQVHEANGQHKLAETSFEEAIAALEKAGAQQHLGDALAVFSDFLQARGQSQRAFEVLRQAWTIRESANA